MDEELFVKELETAIDMEECEMPAKKQKQGDPSDISLNYKGRDLQWRIRFSQGSTFKSFMENVKEILPECALEIVHSGPFNGISVESIDPSRISLLQGRLSAKVKVRDAGCGYTFCVRMATVISSLKSIAPSYFVDIWSEVGSTDIVIYIYEPKARTPPQKFVLKTLAKQQETLDLEGMQYDILTEMDLQNFRNVIKTAKEHRADCIEIAVYSVPRELSVASNGFSDSTSQHLLVLSYAGDEAQCEICYPSVTEEDSNKDGPTYIKAIDAQYDENSFTEKENLKLLYKGSFGCESIAPFIKSVERHALTLRMASNQPLIIDHPIGSSPLTNNVDGDFLRLILAPRS